MESPSFAFQYLARDNLMPNCMGDASAVFSARVLSLIGAWLSFFLFLAGRCSITFCFLPRPPSALPMSSAPIPSVRRLRGPPAVSCESFFVEERSVGAVRLRPCVAIIVLVHRVVIVRLTFPRFAARRRIHDRERGGRGRGQGRRRNGGGRGVGEDQVSCVRREGRVHF